jgi:hypothetical protein
MAKLWTHRVGNCKPTLALPPVELVKLPEAAPCVDEGDDDAGSLRSYSLTNCPFTPATSKDGEDEKNFSDVIGSPGANLCNGSGIEEDVDPGCFVNGNGCA